MNLHIGVDVYSDLKSNRHGWTKWSVWALLMHAHSQADVGVVLASIHRDDSLQAGWPASAMFCRAASKLGRTNTL
jgi:hypothetical protein